jgi:hypothetical protein
MSGPGRSPAEPGGVDCERVAGPATGSDSEPGSTARPTGRLAAALTGFRQPVVLVLFLIAFFSSISGKPIDGLLIAVVAALLTWDAGARAHRGAAAARPATPVHAPASAPRRGGRRRLVTVLAWLAGATLYAALTGSFPRYSWPATALVLGLGAAVLAAGWRGPLRGRPPPGQLPMPGALAWVVILIAAGLWELAALLQQPSLTTDSAAHPTISTLADPLLASGPGRALALAVWLGLGWFLVER